MESVNNINIKINQCKEYLNQVFNSSELPISVIVLIVKDTLRTFEQLEQEYLVSLQQEMLNQEQSNISVEEIDEEDY